MDEWSRIAEIAQDSDVFSICGTRNRGTVHAGHRLKGGDPASSNVVGCESLTENNMAGHVIGLESYRSLTPRCCTGGNSPLVVSPPPFQAGTKARDLRAADFSVSTGIGNLDQFPAECHFRAARPLVAGCRFVCSCRLGACQISRPCLRSVCALGRG